MSRVHIPAPLRRLTGGLDCAAATGATVGELVADLDRRFPGLRDALVENDDLAPHLAVSVDGVVGVAGLAEPVSADSEVHFVPPLGGG